MNILVLCTGNSARSILLEALLNRLGKGRVTAFSAGSQPAGKVHPQSLSLLADLGFDTTETRSKSWDEFASPGAPTMDIVITVCGSAAGETCPMWPAGPMGAPLRAHWGVDDPAATAPADWDRAFKTTFARLKRRAEALLDLPFADLDRLELQRELNRIGTL